jgi:hypothetical protein
MFGTMGAKDNGGGSSSEKAAWCEYLLKDPLLGVRIQAAEDII